MICFKAPEALAQDGPDGEDLTKEFIYETPSLDKFSKLYWALGKNDLNNDKHVDEYLKINECDIYKQYFSNEFEWINIRDAGRQYIEKNRKFFPLRFEIVQRIRLGEYNLEEESFEIVEEDKIDGIRKFEIVSGWQDRDTYCLGFVSELSAYPPNIIAEFNRPVVLEHIPVDPQTAREYLELKMKDYQSLSDKDKIGRSLYDFRDAYVVIKMQFFTYKDDFVSGMDRYAHVLAVLEAIHIYGDQEREILLDSNIYRRKKSYSSMEQKLREEFAERQREKREKEHSQEPRQSLPEDSKLNE